MGNFFKHEFVSGYLSSHKTRKTATVFITPTHKIGRVMNATDVILVLWEHRYPETNLSLEKFPICTNLGSLGTAMEVFLMLHILEQY